jgi:lysophospholipase L1-like esterase
MTTLIDDRSKFLLIGDSITDCGRKDNQYKPYGCGYVSKFRDLVIINEAEKNIEIINTGIGGNTIEDLRSRWDDDLLSYKPDWVSIMIGINDINRFLSNDTELQNPENFEKIYNQIIADTKAALPDCKIVLLAPFYMSRGHSTQNAYRTKLWDLLPTYIGTVKKMSEKYDTMYMDTQELFQYQLKYNHPSVYGVEPVHPNSTGNMLIAQGLYDIIKK